jgi:hypothetical protein
MMSGGFEKLSDKTVATEIEIAEALRLARDVRDLLGQAGVNAGRGAHGVRIAQAIAESLVDELEVLSTGAVDSRRVI